MQQRGWTARRPAWVTPSDRQVSDLWWLAVMLTGCEKAGRTAVDECYTWAYGVQDALGWIEGGLSSPVGCSDVQPVTKAAAAVEAELAAVSGKQYQAAGAEYQLELRWVVGVASTLLWLCGVEPVPMRLPVRTPDGEPAQPAELFLAAVEEFGYPATEEEQRRLHEWSIEEAHRSRELVATIDETYRRMVAVGS
jgi:hypothetical protein